jgi:hypothetical protein
LRRCDERLNTVVSAANRDQYFEPVVKDPDFYPSSPDSGPAIDGRGLVKALAARAMLHCGEGDYDAAWKDLLACHRLVAIGRMAATVGLVEPYLAAMPVVFRADQTLLRDVRLPSQELRRIQADLIAVPESPAIETRIAFSDRCLCLSGAIEDKRYPVDQKERERALRMINEYFDRISAIAKLVTYRERCNAAERIEVEWWRINAKTRGIRGGAEVLFCAHSSPTISFFVESEGRCMMMKSLVEISCSVEAYRRRVGTFPSNLAVLVPEYVKTIPTDVFDGKEVKYRRNGDGCSLYSVGRNGVRDDRASGDYDDIVVER